MATPSKGTFRWEDSQMIRNFISSIGWFFNGCGKDRKGLSLLLNLLAAQFLRGLSRDFVNPAIGSSAVEASPPGGDEGWAVVQKSRAKASRNVQCNYHPQPPRSAVPKSSTNPQLSSRTPHSTCPCVAVMAGALQLLPLSTLKEQRN